MKSIIRLALVGFAVTACGTTPEGIVGAPLAKADVAVTNADIATAAPDALGPDATTPDLVADDTSPADIAADVAATPDDVAPDTADTSPVVDVPVCVPKCDSKSCDDGCGGHCDGQACDDGSACTTADKCSGGACAGTPAICADASPCTYDSCDSKSGCLHLPNTATCTDDNACTVGDACASGVCTPGAVTACDDDNSCTTDSCQPDKGCSHLSNTLSCSDGNACTSGDTCAGATCVGKAITCDDKNACTTDSCNPNTGCDHTTNTNACDDANPCTVGDICQGGNCAPGKPKVCDAGNVCVIGTCSPTDGKCMFTNAASGLVCDDGNACTSGDACAAGDCSGTKLSCDDANVCTDDTCDGATGCSHMPNSASCEDGNGCTLGDACVGKDCISGSQKSCDDKSPCTKDSCSVATGDCVHNGTPFEGTTCDADGSVCTKSDSCISGVCTPGVTLACDDGSVCTDDLCDAKAGCAHVNNTAPCDADGNACTVGDACNAGSCIVGKATVCNDKNPCTNDKCDAKTGNCAFDFATTDGVACNYDDSLCTAGDSCKSGACAPGPALPCDDSNVCTDDGCNPTTGCLHTANTSSCNADNNLCTVGDACSDSLCKPGKTNSCSDGNPCTVDKCDSKTGLCSFDGSTTDGQTCDDGSLCTVGDSCLSATCTPGSAPNCNDGNVCTDDSCDTAKGCVHAANTAACDDGDACTLSDACLNSKCTAGAAMVCSVGEFCQTGTCDPVSCTVTPQALESGSCGYTFGRRSALRTSDGTEHLFWGRMNYCTTKVDQYMHAWRAKPADAWQKEVVASYDYNGLPSWDPSSRTISAGSANVSSDGTLHVVFRYHDAPYYNTYWTSTPSTHAAYATKKPGGTWSVKWNVFDDQAIQSSQGNGQSVVDVNVDLWYDTANNTLHSVGQDGAWWAETWNVGWSYASASTGAWSTASAIYSYYNGTIDSGAVTGVDIDGDTSGNAFVAWYNFNTGHVLGRTLINGAFGDTQLDKVPGFTTGVKADRGDGAIIQTKNGLVYFLSDAPSSTQKGFIQYARSGTTWTGTTLAKLAGRAIPYIDVYLRSAGTPVLLLVETLSTTSQHIVMHDPSTGKESELYALPPKAAVSGYVTTARDKPGAAFWVQYDGSGGWSLMTADICSTYK